MARLDPIHPGEILKHEYMEPFGLSVEALAGAIDISVEQIDSIIRGQGRMTADLSVRFARLFNTDAQSWLNLQTSYELELIDRNTKPEIQSIQPLNNGKARSLDL